jgi:hypothetical protein
LFLVESKPCCWLSPNLVAGWVQTLHFPLHKPWSFISISYPQLPSNSNQFPPVPHIFPFPPAIQLPSQPQCRNLINSFPWDTSLRVPSHSHVGCRLINRRSLTESLHLRREKFLHSLLEFSLFDFKVRLIKRKPETSEIANYAVNGIWGIVLLNRSDINLFLIICKLFSRWLSTEHSRF